MFDRIENLLGKDVFSKFQGKRILIVGIGGVGGIVLEALVRSGFDNITIIDKDVFEISNNNRQLMCNIKSINKKKVVVAKKKMKNINPKCKINALFMFLDKDNIQKLGDFDYIVDTCDTIDTKLELYKYAEKNSIKIISSMGMGKRVDLSKIKIGRLDKTLNDPLAKKIRFLCKQSGINPKIPVVTSSELPKKTKNITSMFTVTNTAGILIADYIIKDIIK